jgi:magnesium transporter
MSQFGPEIHDDIDSPYPLDSVGRIMTTAVPTTRDTATIGDIEQYLFQRINDFRSINYTYVLNENRKLVGIISIKELFRQSKETKVINAMRTDTVTVNPFTDQERASHLALKHSIKAIPVTDEKNTFLGVVLSDAILNTLYRETSEDLFGLAGVRRRGAMTDTLSTPLFQLFKFRLPWLLLGILGSLLAAGFISKFEATLQQNILLAAFIPLVVYISSAVAEQTQAFVVRDLALNPSLSFRSYMTRQTLVTFLLGIAISLILLLVGIFLHHSLFLGVVLAISNFFAILASVVTGFILPYYGEKLFDIDPANAGGPIATIIQDVISVLIYFATAFWLL